MGNETTGAQTRSLFGPNFFGQLSCRLWVRHAQAKGTREVLHALDRGPVPGLAAASWLCGSGSEAPQPHWRMPKPPRPEFGMGMNLSLPSRMSVLFKTQ